MLMMFKTYITTLKMHKSIEEEIEINAYHRECTVGESTI